MFTNSLQMFRRTFYTYVNALNTLSENQSLTIGASVPYSDPFSYFRFPGSRVSCAPLHGRTNLRRLFNTWRRMPSKAEILRYSRISLHFLQLGNDSLIRVVSHLSVTTRALTQVAWIANCVGYAERGLAGW